MQTISEQDEELPGVTSCSSLPSNSSEPRNGPTEDELSFLCFVFLCVTQTNNMLQCGS